MIRRLICCLLAALFAMNALAAKPGAFGRKPKDGDGAPKAKKNEPGSALFASNAPILSVEITISGGELAALKKDDRAYVRGNIAVGSNVLRDVAFRVKGNGSRRPLHEKPSFVAKFDHFVPDQQFLGLTKLALNNSSQDGTYLADYMANAMFADANVPVSRVTHARVKFNDRDLGLYVVVESQNKDFLKRWFRNPDGNLYEAYVADIDTQMDQDGGEGRGQKDRQALVDVVKLPDANERWAKLPQVLDVDRYVSHLVCEIFTSHTDGYAMNRNNYRIYHDPDSGRFTFFGHGVDWAFANTGVNMHPPRGSLVTKAVLESPAGSVLFRERRLTLFTNIFQLEVLTNRVHGQVARMLSVARNTAETNDFRRCGQEMNSRLVQRWQFLTNQLFGPPPVVLAFNPEGVASLTGWRKKTDENAAPAVHQQGVDGERRVLRIAATNGPTIASWRTRVQLPVGKYLFEGMVRGEGIAGRTNETGMGAGLRISGSKRENKLQGSAGWTPLSFSLTNQVEDSVELVCELRATRGEVWFDEGSLRLVRQKD